MNLLDAIPYTVYETSPTYTYTYRSTLEFSWSIALMAVPLAVLGYVFYKNGNKLKDKKQECTIEVRAVITAVRKGNSIDGHFGGRGVHYNADYEYVYEDQTYNSHNNIYGNARQFGPKVGDVVTIRINPFEPTELFDSLAESAMHFYFASCVCMALAAGMLTVGQILVPLLQ